MIAAVRESLGQLARRELIVYWTLLSLRSLAGLLDVVGVALIGLIASVAAGNLTGSAAPTYFGVQLAFLGPSVLMWLALFVLIVFVVKSLFAILLTRQLAYLIARVESKNSVLIDEHLLGGSLDEITKYSKAELQFAVTGSTSAMFSGLLNAFATIVSEGFLMVAMCATFVVVSPLTALFALLYFVGVALAIQLYLSRALRRAGQGVSEGTIQSIGTLSDSIETYREMAVMGKTHHFVALFAAARRKLSVSNASLAFMGGMPRYIIETSLIVGVVALVGAQFLTNNLVQGAVTVGVFLAGGMRITASLLPLQNSFAQIRSLVEQSRLASELLRERAAKAVEHEQPVVSPSSENGVPIAFHDVTFRYPGSSEPAIERVTLSVEAGSFAAVIGPSGAGKTTLVDLLLGLLRPESGAVSLGAAGPMEMRLAEPGAISYVPQRPGLVSGSIADNVAFGVEETGIDRDRVREVLEAAHLGRFVDSLPEGIDTSVGKQANALSGGQIQRIGLARALYPRPRLLIMDEATSALDAGSEAFISAELRRLHGSVTVVVVAHRLSTVQHADIVYVMENGRVTAGADFATLMATVPMVAEYVKLMAIEGA